MSRNVLVTGGAGYIGSHTCKALAAAGYQPVAYDNLSEGHRWAVKWGPLVEGDIGDRERLLQALKTYRIGAVLHFAAHAYVGESMVEPSKYFDNNVSKSLTLLNAMLEAKVEALVFSSSCATFGVPEMLPIAETAPQRPINPYGASKLMVEQILQAYAAAYGLKYAALRYFNAAGADPDGELGEAHEPETHLIPLVIEAAQGRRPHISVFGTDYDTADGTAVRDYIHVSDLAEAHVKALDHLRAGGQSERLNLGTGTGYSIREVIATVEQVSGRAVPVVETARRPGDPAALVAGAGRAQAVLGWRPTRSDLPSIVQTAWRWHERNQAAAQHLETV